MAIAFPDNEDLADLIFSNPYGALLDDDEEELTNHDKLMNSFFKPVEQTTGKNQISTTEHNLQEKIKTLEERNKKLEQENKELKDKITALTQHALATKLSHPTSRTSTGIRVFEDNNYKH